MKLLVIASVGLALAVVVAAQALRAPERERVIPIELPNPATRSDDEPAKAPAGQQTRDRKAGPLARAGRPVKTGRRRVTGQRPPQPPPAGGTADDDRTDDRSRAPEQPAPPPPASGSDDAGNDSDTGDDAGEDDAGDDDDGGD